MGTDEANVRTSRSFSHEKARKEFGWYEEIFRAAIAALRAAFAVGFL
jgi:hypothetical protein